MGCSLINSLAEFIPEMVARIQYYKTLADVGFEIERAIIAELETEDGLIELNEELGSESLPNK